MPDYGPVLQARIHNCYEKYALAYQQNLDLKQEDKRLKEANKSQEEIQLKKELLAQKIPIHLQYLVMLTLMNSQLKMW